MDDADAPLKMASEEGATTRSEELIARIASLEEELKRVKEEQERGLNLGQQQRGQDDIKTTAGTATHVLNTPSKKRRFNHEKTIIATNTPSPKRPKLGSLQPTYNNNNNNNNRALGGNKNNISTPLDRLPALPPPKPSNLLSNLGAIHKKEKESSGKKDELVKRSTGFNEPAPAPIPKPKPKPAPKAPTNQFAPTTLLKGVGAGAPPPKRDTDLRLLESLHPGPYTHTAPPNDPSFSFFEPHSGIHLSSRQLPHSDLQTHLTGRYFLSPSLLYSVVRPLPGNAGYDVPVEGDWMTMGVIAKRGEIAWTNASMGGEDDVEDTKGKGKGKGKPEQGPVRRKKYMSIKLVDFGTRSRSGYGKATQQIRGDALLTMLLFEADEVTQVEGGGKVYRGGSGGAFEACMKLHEGAVIAILNPKIMKPYKYNMSQLHPTQNILAITPTSAESIAIIGQSRDLGMCGAIRRDGKVCGDWCDKRVSEYCEYHVEHAVKQKRTGRAEFSVGTSGMSRSAKVTKTFDPERKWGLQREENSGSTYIFSGHIIGGGSGGPEYVEEKIGRERAERAKRRREAEAADEMLNRELGKRGYSAEMIKAIGFDPAAGGKKGEKKKSGETKRKLGCLSLERLPDVVHLGRRPTSKATVMAPVAEPDDNSSSELEID